MAAAQARRKGLLRRAGGMRYSPSQCCHADAPLGRTQRGDGGQSPPLPGRVCRLAFGARELPLSGAIAVWGPSRSGGCLLTPHVRHPGRAARGPRTYARSRDKIQSWFSNSVVVAERDPDRAQRHSCRRRPHAGGRGSKTIRASGIVRDAGAAVYVRPDGVRTGATSCGLPDEGEGGTRRGAGFTAARRNCGRLDRPLTCRAVALSLS